MKQCEISEILNKYISFEEDSKKENEKSNDDSNKYFVVLDDNNQGKISNKNEDKTRKISVDDF